MIQTTQKNRPLVFLCFDHRRLTTDHQKARGISLVQERMHPSTKDHIELLFHWHRYCIAANLAHGKTVLDIGCGEGYGAAHLATAAAKVLAVDIDQTSIEKAKGKYRQPNLTFTQGQAHALPCPDHAFDLVVALEIIEHLPQEQQQLMLQEVRRVLKPDGLLLISTPDKNRTQQFEQINPYHIHELTQQQFLDLLKQNFSQVGLYLQEINLASLVWPADGNSLAMAEHRITFADAASMPTDTPLDIHLYMLALCGVVAPALTSLCHDITRKPLEHIWQQNASTNWQNQQLQQQNQTLQQQNQSLQHKNQLLQDGIHSLELQNKTLSQAWQQKDHELIAIKSSLSWRWVQKINYLAEHSWLKVFLKPLQSIIKYLARRGEK